MFCNVTRDDRPRVCQLAAINLGARPCRCVTGVRTAMLRSGVGMLPPITRQLSAWDDRAARRTVATGTKSTMEGHIIIDVNRLIG